MSALKQLGFQAQSLVYLSLIFVFPFYITSLIHFYSLLIPLVYFFSFLGILCGLALLHRHNIVEGKFPRLLSNPTYAKRRLYGLLWTCLYYNTPFYHIVLSIPLLKRIVFRSFGYKGSLDVTLYPDTWIRDLPLLDIGKGVYIANKATLGTNMPMLNGKIQVSRIKIGDNSLIGHLTKIAPNVAIGKDTEIATDCAIGLSVRIGDHTRIGSCVVVHHYAQVGDNVQIGSFSYIGTRCRIGDAIKIPPGTILPEFSRFLTQADMDAFLQRKEKVAGIPAEFIFHKSIDLPFKESVRQN